MTYIVPFQEDFCQEIHTVYYVNNDHQGSGSGNVTTSEKCPHCGERHIFKLFEEKGHREDDEYVYEIYDCKCPSCRKEFDIEIEFEI
jgi:DNA-directed RNA polymerase subunit M/transcription elongation factor TFIIS